MLWSQPQRFFPVWGLGLSGFQSTRAPASSTAFSCTKWFWSRSAFTQSEPENKRVGGNTLRGGQALAQSKSNWETRWVGLAPLLLSLLAEIQRPALPLSVQNSAAQRSCPSPWGDSIRLGGLPVCIRVEKQLLPGAG